ncbi:hypothetical protein PJO24_004923 [Salmonella enterica]|nr:hypothetical protein [Salmonella enterica]
MSRKEVGGLTELVYSLICENPGIFKYELYHKVSEFQGDKITHGDLDDVIFYLRIHRGIFVMRGYGYFENENKFHFGGCDNIPGKVIRNKWE